MPLLSDDYEVFLALAAGSTVAEIQRVTGVALAADLESDDEDLE